MGIKVHTWKIKLLDVTTTERIENTLRGNFK